jgi:F-type H+-transporting ATPase subunit b
MQEIVHQLGELFLQAVPTVLILLVFYFLLRSLFFKPLLRVMAEREARTAGARKAAESAQAAAAEKIKQYQEALRHARAKVYGEQEAARKKLLDQRAALLKEARGKAAAEVAAAKERIAAELGTARQEIAATVAQLSAEIARRVLQISPQRPPSGPARGAQ